ncbi:butyrophilin-like protein 10 [Centropristis striata]|uniref:butyrophilin-like protein 10 n=1 Tax=Centropristis striata TaxID=184440 RepID=UPI0027E1EF3D|nr:butyrophilin-like protein 10 [Centropristis striata]
MMLHVKVRQSGAFTVVFLALIHSCGGSQVIGQSQPIVGTVGDDIILPCHLEPAVDASGMTVEWTRPDLDPRLVHGRREGLDLKSEKHPSYRGRTSLFTDELKHGNISLKLSEVKVSDEGVYRCFIPELGKESFVHLVVGAVSSPVIRLMNNSSRRVVLQCESAGWYPEPEVLWLDGEGKLLSAGPTETVRGPDDLYTVSSRVTVEKRHSNSFTCRVKNTFQTRETQTYERVIVGSDRSSGGVSYHSLNSSSYSPLMLSLVVCLPVLFILAATFVILKFRQEKFKNKSRSPEDQADQTEEDSFRSDHKGFQEMVEEEQMGLTLMAGREEEYNMKVKVNSELTVKDSEFTL